MILAKLNLSIIPPIFSLRIPLVTKEEAIIKLVWKECHCQLKPINGSVCQERVKEHLIALRLILSILETLKIN